MLPKKGGQNGGQRPPKEHIPPPIRVPLPPGRHGVAPRGHSFRVSSALSEVDRLDAATFHDRIDVADDTVRRLREELKARLLAAAGDFQAAKTREEESALASRRDADEATAAEGDANRGYVIRLLHKIVRKISRRNEGARKRRDKSGQSGVLTSDSFRQAKLDVGAARDTVVALAEQLALLNPTPSPTRGFRGYGGSLPSESMLAGNWKLRFTTAADASFYASDKRGRVTTSQVVDADEGTFTNVVDFEKGKLKGFRVVVAGAPVSPTDVDLTFRAVEIDRRSRFPRLFGRLKFRLPSRLIRRLAATNKSDEEKGRGPYLRLRYLDGELRMHTTDSGNWFIQTRIS